MQRHQKPPTGVMGRKYWLEDNLKFFNAGNMSDFIRVHTERLTALESAIIGYRDRDLLPCLKWEEESDQIAGMLVDYTGYIDTYLANCSEVLGKPIIWGSVKPGIKGVI